MIPVHSTLSPDNNKENEFEHQLQTQKNEYEAIIQRHLKFIDQVIDFIINYLHEFFLLVN